jgi:hypothetical protein
MLRFANLLDNRRDPVTVRNRSLPAGSLPLTLDERQTAVSSRTPRSTRVCSRAGRLPTRACTIMRLRIPYLLIPLWTILMFACDAATARSQTAADTPVAPPDIVTMFPHSGDSAWWLSGQLNLISQSHGGFTSPYAGENSFRAGSEQALSRVWTIYTGLKVGRRLELLFDLESAGGRGLSDALGLAGFTNLDVVRNPTLGSAPYVARVMAHVTIPLGDEFVDATPNGLSLASRVPARRLEIRLGKLGMADFFDLNTVGSDSHLQFTNWTIDNNGAYDYAADTRGYTYAAIVEYDEPRWALRFGEALMPKVANGIDYEWDVTRAHAENLELEVRPADRTTIRLLGYANHANMGDYNEAIQGFLSGRDPRPDVTAYREQGRVKTGVGVNAEYAFPTLVRLFARTGWNEGNNESFAYTEVNNSVQGGGDVTGSLWKRSRDRVGVAFVSNGLSAPHRDYLALGGLGFLLGDGALRYGRENILEAYYTARLWRGLSASAGLHHIGNPGYNQDRGPVLVGMARLHVDF